VKSTTLVTTLTSLTTAMAVAAPVVVFGFLYVLQIQPERLGATAARSELDAALADLQRRRLSTPGAAASDAAAVEHFVVLARKLDRADDLVDVLTELSNSSVVGGVSNLHSRTSSLGNSRTLITLTFDARYEQIVRFFRAMGALPPSVTVQSVEISAEPSSPGLRHMNVSLLASPGGETTLSPKEKPPRGSAAPRQAESHQPDHVVSSILISNGRRVARVDGRIVGPGDRLRAGVVESIEPDAIVLTGPDGRPVRIGIERPANGRRTR
jgi:Tfp pilus assembly protein PilO